MADFHRNNSGLSVRVVALENIYQEFSSGKQDVAAIRNFIKYVYWNASDANKRVKYVNLFEMHLMIIKNDCSIIPI